MPTDFATRHLGDAPDAIAPDGSEVRLLGALSRGSMAAFRLAPKAVSKAVAHRTVEEIWFFTAGHGRMWRRLASREEITEVAPGVSITIPTGSKRWRSQCRPGRVTKRPVPSREYGSRRSE